MDVVTSSDGTARIGSAGFEPRAVNRWDDGRPTVLLAWEGEVDLEQVAVLRQEIDRLPVADVRLDLGRVSFIDSCGLGLLVQLRNRVRANGRRVVLLNVPPQVRRVMEITGLDRVFDTAEASSAF
jgi:anti-anti-sigma factor